MSDTAAFFASKKKKKKAFKGFNANKIDAAAVTSTVHVDAPALSTDTDVAVAEKALASATLTTTPETTTTDTTPGGGETSNTTTTGEWDDDALAATMAKKNVSAAGGSTTAELLDMKALEVKRREQDDIAERLRVEETKAQLAAAREGMEKEAARLKEAAEKKQEETKKPEPVAAATAASGGGRWVPPHLRAGGSAISSRFGNVSSTSTKLDVADENLFPDLAVADKMLEEEKKKEEKVAYKVHKKTPVGGGATWASRPSVTARPKQAESAAPEPPKQEEPKKEVAPAAAPATSTTTVPKKKPPTKKKKKDLSTFKPSSTS